jgi:hypothetical protein
VAVSEWSFGNLSGKGGKRRSDISDLKLIQRRFRYRLIEECEKELAVAMHEDAFNWLRSRRRLSYFYSTQLERLEYSVSLAFYSISVTYTRFLHIDKIFQALLCLNNRQR